MGIQTFAVAASIAYFVGFGAVFLFMPSNVDRLGLKWINPAGKTEVRCYYGAISWAIAAFLAYLLSKDLSEEALTGVIFLAGSVLSTRLIGAFVDKGWSEEYNRQAIPIEATFVIALLVCRLV